MGAWSRCATSRQFLVVFALLIAGCTTPQPHQPRILRVALYPYIPDAETFYLKVQAEFQKQHPEIELVINELNENYCKRPAEWGPLSTEF